MKSLVFISILTSASAALAQSSSSQNPLIPSGISENCNSFLTNLNSDSDIAACVSPLMTATANYAPGGNASSKPSVSDISTALANVCSISASCDASSIRSSLANFYTSCDAELTSNAVPGVVMIYDVLYALIPLQTAICVKDTNGQYCATEGTASSQTATSAATSASANVTAKVNIVIPDAVPPTLTAGEVANYLANSSPVSRRSTTNAVTLNETSWGGSNLVFMFLNPSLPAASLCTSCTRSILTAYINFETATPYAPGMPNSPLMSGQPALYSAIQQTCGASFLSGAVQAAGGLGSNGPLSGQRSGSFRVREFTGTVGVVAGLVVAGSLF